MDLEVVCPDRFWVVRRGHYWLLRKFYRLRVYHGKLETKFLNLNFLTLIEQAVEQARRGGRCPALYVLQPDNEAVGV